MKFCLIAPGFLEIPPKSWGAVEIIIWDYKYYLEKLGHDVKIVNINNKKIALDEINNYNPDICHCHYDYYSDVLNQCNYTTNCMIFRNKENYKMIAESIDESQYQIDYVLNNFYINNLLNCYSPKSKLTQQLSYRKGIDSVKKFESLIR